MTNPLVPFAGELYTGGVKTQVFLIPAAQSASYWTAADSLAVSGVIADIINSGTVPLSTSLGSISGAFSSTIGTVSGAFSSTIGTVSGAFSSTIGAVSSAFSATIGAVSSAFSSTIGAVSSAFSSSLSATNTVVNALSITGAPPGVAWLTNSSGLGSIIISQAPEFGVAISASGMASYVGFTATNPSGSAIDATINPNNGAIVFNLGHNPTDGGTDASTIQAATNNGFVNSGGPTFMGQHASLPFRIYGTSGLAFGTSATDVCQVTGILHLNDVLRLKSTANAVSASGDIWLSGTDVLVCVTGTTYKMSLAAYP